MLGYGGNCIYKHQLIKVLHSWGYHEMETVFTYCALCEGNPLISGGFSSQRISCSEVGCFPEQTVERRVDLPLIPYARTGRQMDRRSETNILANNFVVWGIMMLMCCHCNASNRTDKLDNEKVIDKGDTKGNLCNSFHKPTVCWCHHMIPNHDDVIKRKHFRFTGLLCGEFTDHRSIPGTKASDAELWCFVWSAPEPTIEQTMETLVIWDATALIMKSL